MGRITTWPFSATGRGVMACIPRMADCGGLMIGVDIIEPKVPPLVIENVPPCNASSGNLPLRACVAYSAICRSISTKESDCALRNTGTTRPRLLLTAMPISQ
ncbi:hypothetical protein ExPCM16_04259 [Escherichia coli]|nr:hypothetical protein ExPCM16_04259 [Escherichia coli]